MSTAQHKTLNDFVELKKRHTMTHVVRAATQLGIFDALAGGQRTVEQLADELSLQVLPLTSLMNVLVRTELIERYQDDFALSTLARLIPAPFFDFGDSYWKHLAAHVKEGKSLQALDCPHDDGDLVVQQASEEWMLTPAAMTLGKILDMGGSRKELRILDLGCGSAVFGATLTHMDPSSTLTLVDTAAELLRAKTTIDSIEIAERTVFVGAENWQDFEVIDFSGTPVDETEEGQTIIPQPVFDLVILPRKIHLAPLNEQAKLIKKIFALLLAKGGELAIVDVFPGQENGDEFGEVFELEFGLRHSSGRLHHPRDLEPVFNHIGFSKVQFAFLQTEPHLYGVMLGEKG